LTKTAREVLDLTRLLKVFEVHETETEALAWKPAAEVVRAGRQAE
jgi:hypothetical protein